MKIEFQDQIAHLLCLPLEKRQHLRDKPLSQIPHPRPANLDGPHAEGKPPPLAVTVAIPGLFRSITLALAFLPAQPLRDFLLQKILQVLSNLLTGKFLQRLVTDSL